MTKREELAKYPTLEELEQQYINKILLLSDGNKTVAAQVLDIHLVTLYRKLKISKLKLKKAPVGRVILAPLGRRAKVYPPLTTDRQAAIDRYYQELVDHSS